MDVIAPFIADAQTAVTMQPRQSAFDDPAVTAEMFARLNPAASNAGSNPPLARGPTTLGIIITFVGVDFFRPAARRTAPLADARHGVQHGGETHRVVRVRRPEERGKRKPASFHKEMMLGAELATVGRIRSGLPPPFFAGTVAASRLARDQSIWFAAPSRSSSTWCIRDQTPARCQSRNRRQQVMPLPHPSSAGRYSQGMPVRSTNNIPRKTCRSQIGGRPPFGRFGRGGSNGANTAQSSSLTSSLPMLRLYQFTHRPTRFC